MNKRALGLTSLTAYNSISRIASLIEDTIMEKSWEMVADEFDGNILAAFENICKLIERKTLLINTRIMFEDALSKLQEEQIKLLYLRYFDRFSANQICAAMNFDKKDFRQKIYRALVDYGKSLQAEGLNENRCERLFSDEEWLALLYNYFCKCGERSAYKTKDEERSYCILNEIRKIKCV